MKIRILAVEDPAVIGYVENLSRLKEKSPHDFEFKMVPWAEFYPQMINSLEGLETFDIVMIAGHLWLKDFVEKDYLEPLVLDGDGTIMDTIRNEMKIDGIEYLSPSFCDGHMVVYRKDIINSVLGRNPNDVISPNDYGELAELIHEKYGKASIAMKAHQSEIFTDALPFLRGKGAEVYNSQGQIIDNQEILEKGIGFYCYLKKYAIDGTETFGNTEIKQAITDDKIPLTITWSGQLGDIFSKKQIFDDNIGFATLSTAWNVTWSFGIPKTGSKKKEAKEVLKFLRSKEVDKLIASYSGAPVLMETYQKGERIYPWYQVQKIMLEKAEPLPNILNAGDKNQIVYDEIYDCFIGNKSSSEAAKYIIDKIKVIEKLENGGEEVL